MVPWIARLKLTKKVNDSFFQHLSEAMRALMRERVSNYSEKTDRAWVKIFNNFIIEQITIGQNEYGHRRA